MLLLNIPTSKTVIELNAPLRFTSLKKKLSQLEFWFSSYGHFSYIICKTSSGGQNIIFLFFNKIIKRIVSISPFSEKEISVLNLRFR